MYEKILVPIDGSEASWHALGHACALGKQFGSKITIVHVVEPYYTLPKQVPYGDETGLQQVNIAEVEAAGRKILELATIKINQCFNVCSIDETCYTSLPGEIPEPIITMQEADALDPKALANQNATSSQFDTRLQFGSPANAIIDLAKDEHFNLIVVGSRGLSGISEFLLGSVSNKISHASTIPVLIVK